MVLTTYPLSSFAVCADPNAGARAATREKHREKNFAFNVKEFYISKNELLNKLLELFPADLIEYEDNNVKLELEPNGGYLWT